MEKVVKSKIKHGLPFMVPDLVYKFQLICPRGSSGIEQKSNAGRTEIWPNKRMAFGETGLLRGDYCVNKQ